MNGKLVPFGHAATVSTNHLKSEASQWLAGAFILEVCKNPHAVGAIAPTGGVVAKTLVQTAEVKTSKRIIELGSGTGAITKYIVKGTSIESDILAIEKNPEFSAALRARFPGIKVRCGCVSRLQQFATQVGFTNVESIISALPWTVFSSAMQADIVNSVASLLSANGVFTTVACYGLHLTNGGRRFRSLLEERFSEVRATPVIWRNFPPAFVYRCSK